jgi:hypothetical protein
MDLIKGVAPSDFMIEKHFLASSSLVLIFIKKVGFSLGKVGKVATMRCPSKSAQFFHAESSVFLLVKQIAQIQMKNTTSLN